MQNKGALVNPSTQKRFLIASAGVILIACAATTGVRSIGGDEFTINVYRGDMGKVKMRAYQHAEKYCAENKNQGILVTKENLRSDPSVPNSNMGIMDLNFKCSGPVTSAYGKEVLRDMKK
jgi:hypothetical protein